MLVPKWVMEKFYDRKNGNKNNLAGIEFLRDCLTYLNARNEALNEGKTPQQLITDFSDRIVFNNTNRF